MTESLPITISADDAINALFPKARSVLNKLEAQLNFQSLTAGWYGDEENILSINLAVVISETFKQETDANQAFEFPADDLASHIDELEVNLLVAITEKEQLLLEQKPNLLSKLLQLKLIKATNTVAEIKQLTPLPE